jgi:hypothetical protein
MSILLVGLAILIEPRSAGDVPETSGHGRCWKGDTCSGTTEMTRKTNDGTTVRPADARNERETGRRLLKERRASAPGSDQNAALPEQPQPYGLTREEPVKGHKR